MLSNRLTVILATALAPMLWGTTYFTSTTFLIGGHPLLTATIRALPAGLVLLLIARRLPRGQWWWRSAVLGVLNIGAFFALLFVAADRLPGGVAAVVGGIQPLLVALLASRLLAERLSGAVIAAGAGGVTGVALIVLQSASGLDPIGITAALLGAVSMSAGVVLTKRWSVDQPAVALTAWQLLAGGLVLAALTAVFEPLPSVAPTPVNIAGYLYLTLIGTALAYLLWFRGLAALPTRIPAFLGLLSPLVALAIGVTLAHETLTWTQAAGVALVLISIGAVIASSGRTARVP
ncbi:DMT family transporter [Microbacterium sp. cx-55]|uniref:EamA family transporter n=1 Tax=Microbacterium sp. cx-55 TaxID=2875948 RepID=UPI001CBDEC4C|nr:EamA family transporter [Microbacterium sp. cx-55]MBZ4487243.1 DMT family transporter [Microbacterium sp. cx-55]UGB35266.1 DMT family transporter [Microbacterium sp. cx-55]